MNILIIGSGGREHALAWKIKQSPNCGQIFVAPGNAGTALIAQNLNIGGNDFEKIGQVVIEKNIDLIVVGPEEPLVRGIRNYFADQEQLIHILMVGPDRVGAQLEGSKDFSKNFMNKYGISTAGAKTIGRDEIEEGLRYLSDLPAPYVLKADGLAAGKGVIITDQLEEAKNTLRAMLDGQFGEASSKVLIEEYLHGIELSVFVLTDGNDFVILPEAKDYKRIGEGDTGPNTGGMGAVSPVPFASDSFMQKVRDKVVLPTINGLKAENIDYKGFLFIGLMNVNGEPMVIEYNVRMGDPETQVVLPRIKTDFLHLLIAAAKGELAGQTIEFSSEIATTVVGVAGGYPGSYAKGQVISGLPHGEPGLIFHAGTKVENDEVVTSGGRILASTGIGKSIHDALAMSYQNLSKIKWKDMNYRKDIGQDLL